MFGKSIPVFSMKILLVFKNFQLSLGPLQKSVSMCGGVGGQQQAHVLLLPRQQLQQRFPVSLSVLFLAQNEDPEQHPYV
jgi:hypothetical protein